MNFNTHSDLKDQHAFLGASKYHWLNYSEEKLGYSYLNFLAVQRGTELHEFAYQCIRLGQRLPKSKKSLNMYVNDAIGYRMIPEQTLYYSDNSFGTADAISFRDKLLRIHDLKTGVSPVSMNQLYIYTALFCLEYSVEPRDISVELRIYQLDEIVVDNPIDTLIHEVMNKIIMFDKKIEQLKLEENL
jgi:hypothetical protein